VERALLNGACSLRLPQLQTPWWPSISNLSVLKNLDRRRRRRQAAAVVRPVPGADRGNADHHQDWLTLARIEGDTLSRQRVKVDLKRIVADILATYEEMARQNSFPGKPGCRRTPTA